MEIELKFPLENPEESIKRLNALSKQLKENYQKDTYFIPPHKNFIKQSPISEWLRLREEESKVSFNYKNWHNKDGKTISCDEIETEVISADNLRKILKNLDFKEIIAVEKIRKEWNYKSTKIAIDEVSNLGTFIEIEADKEFKDKKEAENHLYKILKELNIKVGEQDFEGYPYLLLKKKNLI